MGQILERRKLVVTAIISVLILTIFASAIWLLKPNCGEFNPIAFLAPDGLQLEQIFILECPDQLPLQITTSDYGVYEFAVSGDGRSIVYAVNDAEDGSALRLVGIDGSEDTEVHTCPGEMCSNVIWHPDGERILYERRPVGAPGMPRLYWIELDSGDSVSLLEDTEAISRAASFSPDGIWISYSGVPENGLHLFNLETGEQLQVERQLGSRAEWLPNSNGLIYQDFDVEVVHGEDDSSHNEHDHAYLTTTHLFLQPLTPGPRIDLSDEGDVEDSVPDVSPDGSLVAFGRRKARTSSNRQLWLVGIEGEDSRPLTADYENSYGPPLWSPDGNHILFQRVIADDAEAYPSIWQMNIDSGDMVQLISKGYRPAFVESD